METNSKQIPTGRGEKYRILFVCLGNICRSPMAEAVMHRLLVQEGMDGLVEVDSAGILSYHQGELPDARMRMHAARRGYELTHRSRPVREADFDRFDCIVGMDDRNLDDLRELAPSLEAERKVERMCRFCRLKVVDYVPDPYYGGASGFENVIDILEDACQGLLEEVRTRL
ncbi:MAG: low molecular weight protein-tyrosine-phosphatase [Bacteroidaceae bacterium]